MADRVYVLIGTENGGYILESDKARQEWTLSGPCFEGSQVQDLNMDVRKSPVVYAAVGSDVRVSHDLGATWSEPAGGLQFEAGSGMSVERVWQVTPGGFTSMGTVYAGVEPAALFRSDDNGETWHDVAGLTNLEGRGQWAGAETGLALHSIMAHPYDGRRIAIGIAGGGSFETTDGGETWKARNKGIATPSGDADAESGQCVHHVENHPSRPDLLYRQDHSGVFRSNTGGEQWTNIGANLASPFGAAILVHPAEDDTVFVVSTSDAEGRTASEGGLAVLRSRDRGESWDRLNNGLPQTAATVRRQATAADAFEPEAGIYVGTSDGEVYASLDSGDTWVRLAADLPPVLSVEAKVVED